jgi:sporulation protein YlmC with PRC-barrel domain
MEKLLERAVVMNGIRIGRVVDVILDRVDGDVVGYEVRCEDGRHRFLPRAVGTISEGSTIEIDSSLALLDSGELEFYRRRGATLRTREEPAA